MQFIFGFWQFFQIRIHKEPPDLISGGMRVEGVHDVKVGVDHEGRPRSQVDVLLPPVGHVVVRPQPLEPQVPIEWNNFNLPIIIIFVSL